MCVCVCLCLEDTWFLSLAAVYVHITAIGFSLSAFKEKNKKLLFPSHLPVLRHLCPLPGGTSGERRETNGQRGLPLLQCVLVLYFMASVAPSCLIADGEKLAVNAGALVCLVWIP
jgi:hypothetical protein